MKYRHGKVLGDEDKKLLKGYEFKKDISKGLYVGPSLALVSENEEDMYIPKPKYINWGDLSGHLAVVGTTRVGKTRLMMSFAEQIIEKGEDLILVEPKGAVGDNKNLDEHLKAGQESIGWLLEFAERYGRLRHIKYISPIFHEHSLCFNPLFGMGDEEIASLIASIIPAKDEFFKKMGYQISFAILTGLRFLEMAEGPDVVNEALEKEYKKVYSGGVEAILDSSEDIYDPDLAYRTVHRPLYEKEIEDGDYVPFRTLVTFRDIERYMSQKGIAKLLDLVKKITPSQYNVQSDKERKKIDAFKRDAVEALSRMVEKDSAYYSKVSSSFETIFSQIARGDIGSIFCSVKINPLLDAIQNPNDGLIAIIQPYPLIYEEAAIVFVRTLFAMMKSFYGTVGASGRQTPRDVYMFVDEAGAVLYPGVEDLFNKGGGLGLRIFIFTQSFADYKSGLGEEIAEILSDNTNIKIYMRINDLQSRKIVAETFGKYKANDPSYMGSKLDMRISTKEEEKDILLPSHMGDMQKREFLLQYGEGRYYCLAPNMPDPKYPIRMPYRNAEILYKKKGMRFIKNNIQFESGS